MAVLQAIDVRSQIVTCKCQLTLYDDAHGGDPRPTTSGPISLVEDRRYWYELRVDDTTVSASLVADGKVVRRSPTGDALGIIDTKAQAGYLAIAVRLSRGSAEDIVPISLEVLPAKFDLSTFHAMLDEICGQILGLVLRLNSTSRIPLRVGQRLDVSTLQQRFFFLQYLLGSERFRHALEQLTKAPHTRVKAELTSRTRLTAGRLGRDANRLMARGGKRVPVPVGHPLERLGSIPESGVVLRSAETLDSAENRFIKFALEEFGGHLNLIESLCAQSTVPATLRVAEECSRLERPLRRVLEHSMFREVGVSSLLPLGSPVLQGRAGYRDVLEAWLKFHLAASLHWDGADDVFGAGKRDTDKLYEYWLFFQLLTVLSTELGLSMPPAEKFLAESEDGLLFKLRAGRDFVHYGTVSTIGRSLRVRFSYNRTFSKGASAESEGSWTLTMRPDFTITFWPACVDERAAEAFHLAVHLHFDCKYRLENASLIFDDSEDVTVTKDEEKTGNFKRGDLFVAHTYHDAIRRSAGAYIIYPGSDRMPTMRQQYHEVLPSVGAFPVRPQPTGGPTGMDRVAELLRRVVAHLGDYNSSRERVSYETWRAYGPQSGVRPAWPPPQNTVFDGVRTPPAYGDVFIVPPETCFTFEWIREKGVYPVRVADGAGVPLLSGSVLTTSMAVLLRNAATNGLVLARFDRTGVQFVPGTTIASIGAASGVYAMLPLDFVSSIEAEPITDTSVNELFALAADPAKTAVSLEVLTRYVRFATR
jgi:uncharacterized protein DUF2357/PD-(D/E)XK nuclease superfamily protein